MSLGKSLTWSTGCTLLRNTASWAFPPRKKSIRHGCNGCLLNFKEHGHLGKQFAGWPTASSSSSTKTHSGEILWLLTSGITPHSPSKQNLVTSSCQWHQFVICQRATRAGTKPSSVTSVLRSRSTPWHPPYSPHHHNRDLAGVCLPMKANTHLCCIPSWMQPKWSLGKYSWIPWFRYSLCCLQTFVDCG